MVNTNFINITNDVLDKQIYRIMPIHRFLETLEKETLTLVKPHKWDDPFENALLASSIKTSDGELGTISAKDSVYGQCWTLHRETDAMWRIYSQNKDGVRVTTTPRKLLQALKTSVREYPELKCFLGKVQYKRKTALLNSLQTINLLNTNGSGIAESLLYKRMEFKHENEVRLIYCGDDGQCLSDLYHFQIKPNKLFDRILFDPRMDEELRIAYKLAITEKDCKVGIRRSSLYDAPKNFTFNI